MGQSLVALLLSQSAMHAKQMACLHGSTTAMSKIRTNSVPYCTHTYSLWILLQILVTATEQNGAKSGQDLRTFPCSKV